MDRNESYVCDGGTVDSICRECVRYETQAQQYREIHVL
jgi:hypothetical protein